MDILTIGLLATGAVGGIGFLVFRQRLTGHDRRRSKPEAGDIRGSNWQQQNLELDPPTRFLERPKRPHYRLLNDAEQLLYERLLEAMPNMRIFAQIGVAQLAQLRGRQDAQRLHGMAGRGVDFVVCDSDFSIIAAIELAWPGHSAQAEENKCKALESLGIPLIIFRPNQLPDAEALSRDIADAIIRRNRMERER